MKFLSQNTSDPTLAVDAANELLAGQFRPGQKYHAVPAVSGAVGFGVTLDVVEE